MRSGISGRRDRALYPWRSGADNRKNKATVDQIARLFAKSPIPKNVYASAIGFCRDFIIMQSRKPSNSDF